MKKVAKRVRTLTRNNCWVYNVMLVGGSCISEQTDSGIGSTPLKNSMAMKGLTAKELQVSIYLSIYEIYIAPLQGNYSEALPAQARAKIKVLRSLVGLHLQ